MRIRLTRHARLRMRQRRISDDEVTDTLESPDDILLGDDGETIAIRHYPLYEIRVVYEEVKFDEVVVFTVMKAKL